MQAAQVYQRMGDQENALAFEIIGRNCRVPDMLLGDLRAMAGAAKVGAERLHEWLTDNEMSDIVDLVHGSIDLGNAQRLLSRR